MFLSAVLTKLCTEALLPTTSNLPIKVNHSINETMWQAKQLC